MTQNTRNEVLHSLRERFAWYAATKPPSCITSATLRIDPERSISTLQSGEFRYVDDATALSTKEYLHPREARRNARKQARRRYRLGNGGESMNPEEDGN